MYNKGTDKQYIDGTLIHRTIVISDSCTKFQYSRSSRYLMSVLNCKVPGQLV